MCVFVFVSVSCANILMYRIYEQILSTIIDDNVRSCVCMCVGVGVRWCAYADIDTLTYIQLVYTIFDDEQRKSNVHLHVLGTCVCVYVCVWVCVCVCVYWCACADIHIFIYTLTYLYIHSSSTPSSTTTTAKNSYTATFSALRKTLIPLFTRSSTMAFFWVSG